jgi:hypothetical protein
MKAKSSARELPWEQLYARELLAQFRQTPPELVRNVNPFPPWLWDKLRFKGVRIKDQVVGHLPRDSRPARRARAWQWELYKYSCPPWVPWFIYITERQYSGLFQRKRQRVPTGSSPFADLPPARRAEAENLFSHFCKQWTRDKGSGMTAAADLPGWLKPLLVGAARRLARDQFNRSPRWGRQMRRIKGGKHVQRRYRERGWHPLASVRKAWGLIADRPQAPLSLRARLQAMTERENRHS